MDGYRIVLGTIVTSHPFYCNGKADTTGYEPLCHCQPGSPHIVKSLMGTLGFYYHVFSFMNQEE